MRIFYALVFSMLFAAAATAATVHLKDGSSVGGKVMAKDNKSVKLDVDGITMTYYADEIQDIDGTPFASVGTSQPAAPPAMPPPDEQPLPAFEAPVEPAVPAVVPAAPLAAVATDKKQLILKFIDVFGTRAAMTANLAAMLKSLPDDAEAQKLKENIKVNEIIDRLVPIYDKQFSEEDLKAFIDFYASPAGRKLVQGIPVIMRESMGVSSQYLQEKFPELKQEDNKS